MFVQFLALGRIGSIELERKPVDSAKRGQQVAIRITPTSFTQNQFQVGRQFDENDELVSKLTRESIDLLKEFHRDDMEKRDWLLVIKLKKQLGYVQDTAPKGSNRMCLRSLQHVRSLILHRDVRRIM